MSRLNNHDSAGGGAFLLGALAGALVGAGVALLMAPKTGAQVREDLNTGLNTARDAAARRYRDLAEKASARLGHEPRPADSTTSMGDSSSTPGATGYQS